MSPGAGTLRLRERIEQRLRDTRPGGDPLAAIAAQLPTGQVEELRRRLPAAPMRAAVMVPVVERPAGLTVLLTLRASHLKAHAGQVSFPGGRIEASDAGPWQAALREAEEEIGLAPDRARLAGYLRDHFVLTGYLITPAVAIVQPDFDLVLDRTEVDDAFEVPLEFVLDPANRVPRRIDYGGHSFTTWDLPWQGRMIWGATAAMLLNLATTLEDE
jgi:8-oxo-dGTP pyrophosphatase MutT (NUDIX family)